VLGVPSDTNYSKISPDKGRYFQNPATEMLAAFRTGSLRNIEHTPPYMHNGIFQTLNQVIEFYDAGGGTGKGLNLKNQTLDNDSLHLSPIEKRDLIAFLKTLNEDISFEFPPANLPVSKIKTLNNRTVGGQY
jgi:cytochrome c peroxidase